METSGPLEAHTFHHPAIICDAGSTGSRVFAFHVPVGNPHVKVELLGRTTTGLSEFALKGLYEAATMSLVPYLQKGLVRLGTNTPIYIFATGGVRQLSQHLKDEMWEYMEERFLVLLDANHTGRLKLATVHGNDEALFGLLSANYLLGEAEPTMMHLPLHETVGVFDLGGSSLEISMAGQDNVIGSDDDVLISFKTMGLQQMRSRINTKDGEGYCLFGSGSGSKCRNLIRADILSDESFVDTLTKLNLSNVDKFVGISAFVYSMEFAHWLMSMQTPYALLPFSLEFPTPSIKSMRQACDTICSFPYLDALFRQHRFTTEKEVTGRCFDVCYISEVLAILLDGKESERIISFLLEARGNEIEWTLGYYLKHHVMTDEKYSTQSLEYNTNDEL